jgi:hypothetical protein
MGGGPPFKECSDSQEAAAYLADNMDTTLDDETTQALIAHLDTIIGLNTVS